MVDVVRAHRRWLARRLLALGFSAGFAGAVVVSILRSDTAAWLRIMCVALGLLLAAPLVYFLVQTVACSRLHRRRSHREAQLLRRHLRTYPGVMAACLLLLAGLIRLPDLFSEPAPPPLPALARMSEPDPFPPAAPAPLPLSVERLTPSPPPRSDPPSAAAQDPEPAPVEETPGPAAHGADFESEGEEESVAARRFMLEPEDLYKLRLTDDDVRLERPSMPGENDPTSRPPSEIAFDALWSSGESDQRGGAGLMAFDLPFSRRSSVRTTTFTSLLVDEDDRSDDLVWERLTLEYGYRLVGYTRHAAIDVSLSIGVSVDMLETDRKQASSAGRIAPYLGLDVALWQTGAMAILLHAGQSLPLNVTGASSAVTDLSAALRIDLSERVSVRIGYRAFLMRWRDYTGPFRDDASGDGEEELTGPFIGVTIGF
ncbi:MAG: hypothetical protein HYY16_18865 [Planctomycetes bacterium]|nr:hypothetical protein [Planctomycetota bacterium]